MAHLKITFHLDGSGLYFDPHEPIHLDALLAWALAPIQGYRHLDRSSPPATVDLPLLRQHVGDIWVWRASALFPEPPTGESVWYWRKRFRQQRAELTTGSPNLVQGQYRDWQMPVPLMLCTRLVAYAAGSGKELRKIFRRSDLRYMGKKRAHGHGRLRGVDVEHVNEDWSLSRDGQATRWLPTEDGPRLVRPRPPYWHPMGRVRCCEVGDPTEVT